MKGGRIVALVLALFTLTVHTSAGAASCSESTFACPLSAGAAVYDCLPLDWLCDGEVDCPTNGSVHDESNCPPPPCGNDQFACQTNCIDIDWVCDGEQDCLDGRDEENCTKLPEGCGSSQYQCQGSFCIPVDWRCDGDRDCLHADDEDGCDNDNCTETQFMCNTSRRCISKDWVCDGIGNCDDFSDESASCNVNCSESQVLCGAEGGPRICVDPAWICDGEIDCPLGWDESPAFNNCSIHDCQSDEFPCFNGVCIPKSYKCDGDIDCLEGEDEVCGPGDLTLPNCTEYEFLCAPSKTCLHNRQRCDKVRNCPDDSDELNCPPDCDFRCANFTCLSQDHVCDGTQDCSDGSDESDRWCGECSKNNGGCHHVCVNRPTGPLCKCSPGYVLQGGNCYDINECSVYGTCSQLCQNTHGSITCKCVPGYEMEEDPTKGQTCKAIGPPGALYVATNNSIVQYYLNGSSKKILISGLKGVTDIAVDYQEQMIYWLELHNKTLKKASLQDMSNVEVIVSEGINSPEGLALDWLAKRLYWVDDRSNTVEVVNTDGSDRRVLKDGLDRPRDIVVDPFQKILYISDWGTRPGIFSLKTDGSDFTSLVNTSISWPNGLALDFPGKRLYWVDAKYKIVETINLDGTGRVVVKQLPDGAHPWSIDVFEEMMMWSDSEGFRVSFSNRLSAEDIKSIHISQATLKGIKIVHRALQTTGALCSRPSLPNYDLEDPKPFYDVGTVVTLRCAKGNRLTGCDMVKCQENGTWFPPLPNCEPVEGSPAPQRTSTDGLQSYSFGVGLVVGLAVCLLLAVIVVVALVVCFVRKYKQSGRFSSPTISYYSDKHQETTVLPEDDELEPNLANGVPM